MPNCILQRSQEFTVLMQNVGTTPNLVGNHCILLYLTHNNTKLISSQFFTQPSQASVLLTTTGNLKASSKGDRIYCTVLYSRKNVTSSKTIVERIERLKGNV